jgi:hypothetical protein
MRRIFILIAVVFAALMAGRGALAGPQSKGSATLSGVVLGPDDKPVPHASVSYQSSGGIAPHAVYTDSRGRFTITKLKSDNYDVRASSKGIFSEWEKNITLRKGKTEYITLQLIYAREMPKASKTSKPKQ